MEVRRFTVATVAVALVSVLAGACGSGSSSGTATPKPSSTLTGSPIVIGNIGSYSGTQGSSEAGAEVVIKAWAQSVNANGGINGHPLDLIVKDLGANVAGGLDAAKELVQQDHVVAIVGEQDNADTTWAKYIASTGVPVIGGLPINLPFSTNADFFPTGSSIFALIYGELLAAKAKGPRFGFLYCAEAPQCASGVALYKELAPSIGLTVSVAAKVSATAPSYTAVCQQLKDAKVDSYQVGSGSAVVAKIAAACKSAGLTASPLNVDGTATAAWTAQPALDGAQVIEADFPFVSTEGSGPRAYQALIAKYAPSLGSENGPNAAYSFVAGQLFEKAAEAASGDGGVTPASLKQALYSMKGETLGGLAPPLTFTKGKPTVVDCYFSMGLSGGKFTVLDGGKTACAPSRIMSGIAAVAGAATG